MKKIIRNICFFLFITTGFVQAQNNLPPLSVKNVTNIKAYISNYYKADTSFLNRSCVNLIVYIKFKIDNDKIVSLEFSENSPVELKNALKTAIMATDGFWYSTAEEKTQMKNKTFLLPVIFYYQLGCNSPLIVIHEDKKKNDISFDYNNPDTGLHTSLKDMLKFDGGDNYQLLECVLISPMYFTAYN